MKEIIRNIELEIKLYEQSKIGLNKDYKRGYINALKHIKYMLKWASR